MATIEYISTKSLSQSIENTLFAKFIYQPQRLKEMEVHESESLLLINSSLPSQILNTVCRAQFQESQADHYISYAVDYFSKKNLPFLWWISPQSKPYNLESYLKKHGFVHEKSDIALALDLRNISIDTISSIPGITVKCLNSPSDVLDLLEIVEGYYCTTELDAHTEYYKMIFQEGTSLCSPYQYFIAYYQGKPIGFSSYFIENGMAGLYDTLILPGFENCGTALAMMKARFHHLLQQGIHWAVLSSSYTSQQTYERLGFKACGRFSAYSWSSQTSCKSIISSTKVCTIQKA
jgi:hypothetical protein